MEKKRENILFPLGFNSMSITAMAYTMRLKAEMREEFEKKLKDLETNMREEFEQKLKDLQTEIREKTHNELAEKFRRTDDWETIERAEK
jgi:hypothetical protein